jgi:hypothetical protein
VAPVNYLHEGSKAIDEGEQHISIFFKGIEASRHKARV